MLKEVPSKHYQASACECSAPKGCGYPFWILLLRSTVFTQNLNGVAPKSEIEGTKLPEISILQIWHLG